MSFTNLVCFFSFFYGLNKVEWISLILICTIVISSELFNTAIEQAVDTATMEFSEHAKFAKDVAAGAVLINAVGAVFIGIFLFGNLNKVLSALNSIFTDMRAVIFGALLIFTDIAFLLFFKNKNS